MAPLILPFRGKSPRIADDVFIAPGAVVIGDVEIGPSSSVWFNCVLRGDVNHIRIGARSNIQDGTVVHVSREKYPAIIGAEVVIGHRAMLHACVLEDGCLIAMGASVLDGAVVESGAMVAAGALVAPRTRVPGGELWTGVPAAFKRRVSASERDYIVASAKRYVELAKEYRELVGGA